MTRPMYRHPGPAAARLTVDVPDQVDPAQEIDLVRWAMQMRADVAETVGGIMLRSARAVPLTVLPTLLSASPGRLVGWSFHETSGTAGAVVRFHNGADAGQDLVAISGMQQGGVDTRMLPGGGISFTEGLYVEVASGPGLSTAVEGCVYLGAAD